jgi:hypothetical protein
LSANQQLREAVICNITSRLTKTPANNAGKDSQTALAR